MRIELKRIATRDVDRRCYVHARGLITESGFGMITMQQLELCGIDLFHGIEMMITRDGGESFSKPKVCENLKRRYLDDGSMEVMCDSTPFYHRRTGKILLVGLTTVYTGSSIAGSPQRRSTAYAVYDYSTEDFGEQKSVEMPMDDDYFISGCGCGQILELCDGDLLIPIYHRTYENASDPKSLHGYTAIMRCGFDGERIWVKEIGNSITVSAPRGLLEPSIVEFGGEYLVALRNDVTGYIVKSSDGIHLGEPAELKFDDGESVGNYNTQQHWIVAGGRLLLVYTRRAENNSHVFRHRAPLFVAEFDPKAMCIKRNTEKIAVPERGARLGNFGCQSYSDSTGFVFASEWMQGDEGPDGCKKYGSDNSVFVSRLIFE